MNLDFLEDISEADTIEEIWSSLTEGMKEYGFDRLLYAYTRFRFGASLGDPLDSIVLSSHDSEYTEGYISEGHYSNGPMLRWSVENDGACSWSWLESIPDVSLTEGERKALAFNREHNVIAGYTIGFKTDSVRNRGGIGLTAAPGITQAQVDATWERHGREILVMNNMAHLKIISLPYSSSRRALTARQREVLEWVGEGKTMQDIATIMGLTSATVEKHLRLAREALDVDTTAQAVLKASFQNQIFILET